MIPFPPRMMTTTVDETPIGVWMLRFETLCNKIQLILCGLLHCDPSHCFHLCCFTLSKTLLYVCFCSLYGIVYHCFMSPNNDDHHNHHHDNAPPQSSNASTFQTNSTTIKPSHLCPWSCQSTNVPSHHPWRSYNHSIQVRTFGGSSMSIRRWSRGLWHGEQNAFFSRGRRQRRRLERTRRMEASTLKHGNARAADGGMAP